jgi:hypothetical protein
MARKQKEPDTMMEFILNKMDGEDQATAAMIQPLPATVQPSSEFLASTRAHLLSVALEPREARAA